MTDLVSQVNDTGISSHLLRVVPLMEVVEDERRPSVSSTTSKCPTCSTCSSFVDGHEQLGAYQLTKELSDGEFGQIRLGIHSQTREKVAIKLIRKDSDITTSKMDKIQLEIDVLKALDHPHIVKLYDVIETDSRLGLVLEYAAGGELFDYVISQHRVSEQDAKILFVQLIDSVKAMHQIGIVHRDLKLENILFKDVEQTHLLVSDFGFANKGKDLFKTSCGSPCYAAPELVLAPGNYDGRAADIWSCGVILYCMLCGCLPFDDDPDNPDSSNIRQLYHYIQTHPLIFPDQLDVSETAQDLLRHMLLPDPTQRCSLEAILTHSWLATPAIHSTPSTDMQPALKTADSHQLHLASNSADQAQGKKPLSKPPTPATSSSTSSSLSSSLHVPASHNDNDRAIHEHLSDIEPPATPEPRLLAPNPPVTATFISVLDDAASETPSSHSRRDDSLDVKYNLTEEISTHIHPSPSDPDIYSLPLPPLPPIPDDEQEEELAKDQLSVHSTSSIPRPSSRQPSLRRQKKFYPDVATPPLPSSAPALDHQDAETSSINGYGIHATLLMKQPGHTENHRSEEVASKAANKNAPAHESQDGHWQDTMVRISVDQNKNSHGATSSSSPVSPSSGQNLLQNEDDEANQLPRSQPSSSSFSMNATSPPVDSPPQKKRKQRRRLASLLQHFQQHPQQDQPHAPLLHQSSADVLSMSRRIGATRRGTDPLVPVISRKKTMTATVRDWIKRHTSTMRHVPPSPPTTSASSASLDPGQLQNEHSTDPILIQQPQSGSASSPCLDTAPLISREVSEPTTPLVGKSQGQLLAAGVSVSLPSPRQLDTPNAVTPALVAPTAAAIRTISHVTAPCLTSLTPSQTLLTLVRLLSALGMGVEHSSGHRLYCQRRATTDLSALQGHLNADSDNEPVTPTSTASAFYAGDPSLTIYGPHHIDQGQHLAFAIDVCQSTLPELYVLDFELVQGDATSFEFIKTKLLSLFNQVERGKF